MILRLRLPSKFLPCLLSVTGAAVAGAVWTYHGDAGMASKGSAVAVTVKVKGNHHGATRSTARGGVRGKSGRNGKYVSQMRTLAAQSSIAHFSLGGRNFGFGANGVGGVQRGSNSDSPDDVSADLGNLAVDIAVRSHQIAFVEDRSIPKRAPQHHNDDEVASIAPPDSVPPSNIIPPLPIPPPNIIPPLPIPPPNIIPPLPNFTPPPNRIPPPNPIPPRNTVPDFGGTFLLMLCSAAGLLSMRRLASRQLEK
jgi:hypothetical protein